MKSAQPVAANLPAQVFVSLKAQAKSLSTALNLKNISRLKLSAVTSASPSLQQVTTERWTSALTSSAAVKPVRPVLSVTVLHALFSSSTKMSNRFSRTMECWPAIPAKKNVRNPVSPAQEDASSSPNANLRFGKMPVYFFRHRMEKQTMQEETFYVFSCITVSPGNKKTTVFSALSHLLISLQLIKTAVWSWQDRVPATTGIIKRPTGNKAAENDI